jgi:hypothetical protein
MIKKLNNFLIAKLVSKQGGLRDLGDAAAVGVRRVECIMEEEDEGAVQHRRGRGASGRATLALGRAAVSPTARSLDASPFSSIWQHRSLIRISACGGLFARGGSRIPAQQRRRPTD